AAGDVAWAGAGALPGGDGWLVLAPAQTAPLLLPEPGEITTTPVHDALLAVLGDGGALFFRPLADKVAAVLDGTPPSDQAVASAIWDLVWTGRLTNDTMAPLRTVLSSGRPVPRLSGSRRRLGYGRAVLPSRSGPPTVTGRWSLLAAPEPDRTRRLHATAIALLERHGIVARGAVAAERVPGGFSSVYPVLRAMEDGGQCRRGYFVAGLGAAQFALPGAVDRLRALGESLAESLAAPAPDQPVLVLAAADPANAYGAALPWPERPQEASGGHRPGRKAGALVVLARGELVLYVERGGKTLLSWSSDPDVLGPAAHALAAAGRGGALGRLAVERADGAALGDSPLARALEDAGFRPTPRGLRLRAQV
ncbi:MAG: Lhr family helicase, partial [Streptosporangiaceae bacterium]